MKYLLLVIMVLGSMQARSQDTVLAGDWKFYLDDKSSFDFLRLNADGTGIKCFGKTINGKDTLFMDHVTALVITKWKADNGKLVLESRNKVSFAVNPEYKLDVIADDKIKLEGEHLVYYLYPSHLNRKVFQRSVTYQRADKIPEGYGIGKDTCIVEFRNLFVFKPIDKETHLAEYRGFKDLVPYIVGCEHGYQYAQAYYDPPYSLMLPKSISRWSFGFGDKNFYISFNSGVTDDPETSIVIFYDFANELKDFFFSEVKAGKQKVDSVTKNSRIVYKGINWEGKHEGKTFLDNSIVVAYYTRDKSSVDKLQECITSFKYK